MHKAIPPQSLGICLILDVLAWLQVYEWSSRCSQCSWICVKCSNSWESWMRAIGGAYIGSKSNRAVGEKAARKVIILVKPVLPPWYRRFNWWVHFLSFWTSRWRSTDDLFEVHRFNQWTLLVRVQEKCSLLEWTDAFSFIIGLTGEHISSHSVNGNAPV
jgi:hypothetical protein